MKAKRHNMSDFHYPSINHRLLKQDKWITSVFLI